MWACGEGAALALLRGRSAGVLHLELGVQLGPTVEGVEQRHRPVGTDQTRGRIVLDHRQRRRSAANASPAWV